MNMTHYILLMKVYSVYSYFLPQISCEEEVTDTSDVERFFAVWPDGQKKVEPMEVNAGNGPSRDQLISLNWVSNFNLFIFKIKND